MASPAKSAAALHRAALRRKITQASMASMRPSLLDPLFASLTSLPGVGPKLERHYVKLLNRDSPRVIDLLFHLPSGTIDRRARPKLNEVQPGQITAMTASNWWKYLPSSRQFSPSFIPSQAKPKHQGHDPRKV